MKKETLKNYKKFGNWRLPQLSRLPAPLKRHRSQETTRHKIIKCDGGCHSKSKTWQKGYNSQTSMLQNAATMLIFG